MIPIASPTFGKEEQAAVQAVLESGHVASGPHVAAFEDEFATYVHAPHGVATTNGTTALQAALEAMGVGPGDEVVVPAFTFIATANAVLYTGAKPVFADVDPERFTLDPDAAAAAVTGRTKALLPVHLYGQMADMHGIQRVADAHGLQILCDAAQAHGAALDGKPVGEWGDAQTWSFYPTKNMSSIEGGMVTTGDEEIAARVRSIANHGRADASLGQYGHDRRGSNFRLSDVHAAVGRVQLGHLPEWIARRQEIAARYDAAFSDLQHIAPPPVADGCAHAYHQYTLRAADRDAAIAGLKERGVGAAVYYPHALYDYPHLREFRQDCPEADRLAKTVLSIPVHPALSDEDVAAVVEAVRQVDQDLA